MIGIMGGTFDPIHFGHLRAALEIREALALDEIRFVPCGQPPHRDQPAENPAIRALLVAYAVADESTFLLDRRELDRAGPSYTVDTLRSLREELGDDAGLYLILGYDAFLDLPRWHQPARLFELANLIVARRPGETGKLGFDLRRLYTGRVCANPEQLRERAAGRVYFQEVTQLDISATVIRRRIAKGGSARYLLPDSVWAMIRRQGWYDFLGDGVKHDDGTNGQALNGKYS